MNELDKTESGTCKQVDDQASNAAAVKTTYPPMNRQALARIMETATANGVPDVVPIYSGCGECRRRRFQERFDAGLRKALRTILDHGYDVRVKGLFRGDQGHDEHMWVKVSRIHEKLQTVFGVLKSQPLYPQRIARDDAVSLRFSEISGFNIIIEEEPMCDCAIATNETKQ